jgi:23S rRNA (guanosine2251-2'-O)-methyltransferase
MRKLVLILHNLRSTHNVGSLLRTAEGLGVNEVIFSGYTPYPLQTKDSRLPHIARKLDAQIHKTALDAETLVPWRQSEDIFEVITSLKAADYTIAALEQTPTSQLLQDFTPPEKLVIILGREVEGVESEVLAACDTALEIPMFGKKESFNVVQAAAMALYHCRFR